MDIKIMFKTTIMAIAVIDYVKINYPRLSSPLGSIVPEFIYSEHGLKESKLASLV